MRYPFALTLALLATGTFVLAQEGAPDAPATAPEPIPAEVPAPIPPPIDEVQPAAPALPPEAIPQAPAGQPAEAGVQPADLGAPPAADTAAPAAADAAAVPDRPLNEFQGDDVATVLRLLARQAKANLVVSDKVEAAQMTVTMRLENKSPMEAIRIIIQAKGLILDEFEGVYYVKTQEEKSAEPTESAFYTFSYAQASAIAPLLQAQLQSTMTPQVDTRTNTIFYREAKSNLDKIVLFLQTVDRPTRQVMIEARLVEVTANPAQSYGINWSGVFGSSAGGKTFRWGASPIPEDGTYEYTVNDDGSVQVTDTVLGGLRHLKNSPAALNPLRPDNLGANLFEYAAGQYAILTAPQFSLTMRLLNEDKDAEFLANPRVVTADNQKATIKITRNQPVPQLNFNEQTATAVFGGFEDKIFGNTLAVTPSINKDDFITLKVEPEISNKIGDETFAFAGAVVRSPIIDTRTLQSQVLIKSGNTLAVGGLLQDESTKGATKVPLLGDIPVVGYLFQEKLNSRVKRNLLVFVTPTIILDGYGTGLEGQVSGLTHSGEEYADPNGWRNNAKGAIRLLPTSTRSIAADYPKPGTPLAPERVKVKYKYSAAGRER